MRKELPSQAPGAQEISGRLALSKSEEQTVSRGLFVRPWRYEVLACVPLVWSKRAVVFDTNSVGDLVGKKGISTPSLQSTRMPCIALSLP